MFFNSTANYIISGKYGNCFIVKFILVYLKKNFLTLLFVLLLVCIATVPDIANGIISSGDTAPYFINEMITYGCNNNYDADETDLTNECIENTGGGVPAVWSRMTGDLTDVCQAGNFLIDG